MNRRIHPAIACLLLSTFFNQAVAETAPECSTRYDQLLKSSLSLDYQQFDQTPNSGFRVLAGAGCASEAADLIEQYIAVNQAQQNSLRWHVAQLRATSGNYTEAVRYAHTVINEDEDWDVRPLRWNDYVLATIAFLEKDMAALQKHRDAVAAGSDEYFGNALNLKLLDALILHFDRSYQYATSHIGK